MQEKAPPVPPKGRSIDPTTKPAHCPSSPNNSTCSGSNEWVVRGVVRAWTQHTTSHTFCSRNFTCLPVIVSQRCAAAGQPDHPPTTTSKPPFHSLSPCLAPRHSRGHVERSVRRAGAAAPAAGDRRLHPAQLRAAKVRVSWAGCCCRAYWAGMHCGVLGGSRQANGAISVGHRPLTPLPRLT